MRILKIMTLLILLIVISLVGACSKEEEKTAEGSLTIERFVPESMSPELGPLDLESFRFSPPKTGEQIVLERDYSNNQKKINVYKVDGEKELIFTIEPEATILYFVEFRGDYYFLVNDGTANNGLSELWKINIAKGTIKNTHISIGDIFAFSSDGSYICYVYNDYGKYFDMYTPANWAFIPVIKLLNMENGEEIKYDFESTFLNGEWGAIVNIETLADRFNIKFSMDGGTLGKGYILLSDKEFYQTK